MRDSRARTPLRSVAAYGAFLLLTALVPTPLAAQQSGREAAPDADGASPVLAELPEPRAQFRVGLAELVVKTTGDAAPDPEARVAAVTFPRLVYELLAGIDEHDLSDAERRAYSALRIELAVRSVAARLRSLVDSRDRALFAPTAGSAGGPVPGTPTAPGATTEADNDVAAARRLLEQLERLDPALVPSELTRPLVFWAGHAEGRLLTQGEAPDRRDGLAELARAEDLDLIVWGEVEEIEGYLAIDLSAYHRFLGTSEPLGGTIARPEDVGLEAGFVAEEVAPALLGRPFATLHVAAVPPDAPATDAAVFVNGGLRGYDEVRVRFLRPGIQTIRVVAEGYEPAETTVELAPGESRVERVALDRALARVVRIQSSPAGADVYADSVWVGRTPLERSFPPEPTVVRLRRDGYLESRFVVDRGSPEVVSRALLPDSIDWSRELVTARDDFYRSLTWFVLSVPVTVFLNGGFESVRGAFPTAGTGGYTEAEVNRLARLGNILYWSSVGSALVNAGLFVNLVISVFDYVEVGEGPHNQ